MRFFSGGIGARQPPWRGGTRWIDGVLLAQTNANALAFASCLRSLIEACADDYHGLGKAALTIGEHHKKIQKALAGTYPELLLSEEVESGLIHFLYARKVGKAENAPETHRALKNTDYLRELDPSGRVGGLYSLLCEIAHPSMRSMGWMIGEDGSQLIFRTNGRDGA